MSKDPFNAMADCKCPYCGKPYSLNHIKQQLVPEHAVDGKRCPGSMQHPRGAGDQRPLWCDIKVTERTVLSWDGFDLDLKEIG
jgi:hypothetical protein